MHSLPLSKNSKNGSVRDEKKKLKDAESKKLMNIAYHDGQYYIQEPFPDTMHKRDPDLIIEKHCWFVLKYMPLMRVEIKLNDVVRFGRVTFKVTELVISKREI